MRKTMLHLDKALSEGERERFCARLQGEGVTCEAATASMKPHLIFIGYDENRTAPHELVRMAADAGVVARVIDL
ncbi:hypothetical protein [Thiohalomonas denitrificans]|uniref:hypothetical protein n=1 Tax=Thiohalomonas denitrificans TaxID=415747 RepID=UPI0026E9DE45|nr:hypothetical protein [Thiohalomonas denitrificans]